MTNGVAQHGPAAPSSLAAAQPLVGHVLIAGEVMRRNVWHELPGQNHDLVHSAVRFGGSRLRDPACGDPAERGNLSLAPTFDDDCGDDQSGFRHARSSMTRRFLRLGGGHLRAHQCAIAWTIGD